MKMLSRVRPSTAGCHAAVRGFAPPEGQQAGSRGEERNAAS